MQIQPKASVLRFGPARQLTRAVSIGPFTELSPTRFWHTPPE